MYGVAFDVEVCTKGEERGGIGSPMELSETMPAIISSSVITTSYTCHGGATLRSPRCGGRGTNWAPPSGVSPPVREGTEPELGSSSLIFSTGVRVRHFLPEILNGVRARQLLPDFFPQYDRRRGPIWTAPPRFSPRFCWRLTERGHHRHICSSVASSAGLVSTTCS